MIDVTKRKSVGRALRLLQESCLFRKAQSAEPYRICRKRNSSAKSMRTGVTALIQATDTMWFKTGVGSFNFSLRKVKGVVRPFGGSTLLSLCNP